LQAGYAGLTGGIEGGYRFHASRDDHPYVGMEAGLHLFGIGPVLGATLNPGAIASGGPPADAAVYLALKMGI
jgi:hypothetical protein